MSETNDYKTEGASFTITVPMLAQHLEITEEEAAEYIQDLVYGSILAVSLKDRIEVYMPPKNSEAIRLQKEAWEEMVNANGSKRGRTSKKE